VKEEYSPIEEELIRIGKGLDKACGSSYQVCDKCGEKGRGFSDLMEGTFTCIRCYIKKRAEDLEADPEWIKKERVWNMRMAVKRHKEEDSLWTE
jgi:hypothetical protein